MHYFVYTWRLQGESVLDGGWGEVLLALSGNKSRSSVQVCT